MFCRSLLEVKALLSATPPMNEVEFGFQVQNLLNARRA